MRLRRRTVAALAVLTAGVGQEPMPYILPGNNLLARFNLRREGHTMRLEKKT
jgi:hypothetical protein